MQEIEEKQADKGIKVLGLITTDDKENAIRVLGMSSASYKNLIISDTMIDFLTQFSYIPVTIFVNKNGEIVGDFIVGAKSYDEFVKIIDKLLDK